jgi:arylsulfatase A-like enzyme
MKYFSILILAAVIGHTSISMAQSHTNAPNILVFVVDDLGWGDVAYHKGHIPTPHLDRLASEGVDLQRFYVYPVCSPTRAAFLTGQMPRRFGIADVVGPMQNLPEGLTTLPGTLRSAGYQTSLIGKWHLGRTNTPQKNGFDHFYGFLGPQIDYFKHTNQRGEPDWQRDGTPVNEDGYSTFLIADEAIRQLEKRDVAKPFFMEVAFNAPHFPLSAPDDLIAKYKKMPPAEATYLAVVDALDASIGRILASLDKQGLRDSTLVVFFSDNGASAREGGSNGPFRAGKGTVFEGGIRTPCLMRWPSHLKAGTVSLQPLSVQDLFPTLVGAAGSSLKAETKLDSTNLWDALRGGSIQERGTFVIAATDCALFDGEWKLIETSDNKRSLFHITQDPYEQTDVYSTSNPIALTLETKLNQIKKDLPTVTVRQRPGPGSIGGARRGPPMRPPAKR